MMTAVHFRFAYVIRRLADPELVGLTVESKIVHGYPSPGLFDAANDLQADLVITGRHGGSRLEEAVMGSTCRFLAYNAPSDVLVV